MSSGALTCHSGCHLRSGLSSPAPRDGWPLPWAESPDALELEQVALGGHSIGGQPACLYAARCPGRVTRLVLEEPAPPWPRAPRVLARHWPC